MMSLCQPMPTKKMMTSNQWPHRQHDMFVRILMHLKVETLQCVSKCNESYVKQCQINSITCKIYCFTWQPPIFLWNNLWKEQNFNVDSGLLKKFVEYSLFSNSSGEIKSTCQPHIIKFIRCITLHTLGTSPLLSIGAEGTSRQLNDHLQS